MYVKKLLKIQKIILILAFTCLWKIQAYNTPTPTDYFSNPFDRQKKVNQKNPDQKKNITAPFAFLSIPSEKSLKDLSRCNASLEKANKTNQDLKAEIEQLKKSLSSSNPDSTENLTSWYSRQTSGSDTSSPYSSSRSSVSNNFSSSPSTQSNTMTPDYGSGSDIFNNQYDESNPTEPNNDDSSLKKLQKQLAEILGPIATAKIMAGKDLTLNDIHDGTLFKQIIGNSKPEDATDNDSSEQNTPEDTEQKLANTLAQVAALKKENSLIKQRYEKLTQENQSTLTKQAQEAHSKAKDILEKNQNIIQRLEEKLEAALQEKNTYQRIAKNKNQIIDSTYRAKAAIDLENKRLSIEIERLKKTINILEEGNSSGLLDRLYQMKTSLNEKVSSLFNTAKENEEEKNQQINALQSENLNLSQQLQNKHKKRIAKQKTS